MTAMARSRTAIDRLLAVNPAPMAVKGRLNTRICLSCGKTGNSQRDCPDARQGTTSGAPTVVTSSVLITNAYAKNIEWIFDTGVGEHVTSDDKGFLKFQEMPEEFLGQADGSKLEVKGLVLWN